MLDSRDSSLWGTDQDAEGAMSGYDPNGPLAMGTTEELISIIGLAGLSSRHVMGEGKVVQLDAECMQMSS